MTRQTKQRATILNLLRASNEHPTAESLYSDVLKQLPKCSLATVYRILNVLSEEGAIRTIPTAHGPNRFDVIDDDHHHAICTRCGQITDIPDMVSAETRREVERWTGFTLDELRLEWRGLCPGCRELSATRN